MTKPREPRVLICGVDALSLGVRGVVPRAVYDELERRLADRAEPGADHRMELGGEGWAVERGTQWSMARLVREDLVVLVTRNAEGLNNPELVFDFPAATIWDLGLRGCWERARRIAAAIMRHEPRAFVVSRIDLCADVETDELRDVPLREWIGRARTSGPFGEWEAKAASGVVTSYSFGSRKNRKAPYARIYDKPRELQRSRKTWLLDLWHEGGWSGGQVWRVEFELHRPWLVERRGVNRETGELLQHVTTDTLAGLEALIPAMWSYLTDWLTLRRTGRHANARRWELRDTWRAVQAADWSKVLDARGVGVAREQRRAATYERVLPGQRGGLTTLQAIAGEPDLRRFLERLAREVDDYDTRQGTTREAEVMNRAAERNADLAWQRGLSAQASASACKSADSNPAQASAKSEASA